MELQFRRETNHTSAVIDGKLYKTNNAEIIGERDYRVYFRTTKSNYFSAIAGHIDYHDDKECCVITTYFDIRVETEEKAKEILGVYNVERYQELFGLVEEA